MEGEAAHAVVTARVGDDCEHPGLAHPWEGGASDQGEALVGLQLASRHVEQLGKAALAMAPHTQRDGRPPPLKAGGGSACCRVVEVLEQAREGLAQVGQPTNEPSHG